MIVLLYNLMFASDPSIRMHSIGQYKIAININPRSFDGPEYHLPITLARMVVDNAVNIGVHVSMVNFS